MPGELDVDEPLDEEHCDAEGAIVYTVEPVPWLIVVEATPEVQLVVTVPPALEVAITRSRDAEVSVKLPPVEAERVVTTLVAFTVNVSATEPATTMKSTLGEVKGTVVATFQLSGAASATALAAK